MLLVIVATKGWEEGGVLLLFTALEVGIWKHRHAVVRGPLRTS